MESNKQQANAWKLIFDTTADRHFTKLDTAVKKRILDFFERTLQLPNPKAKAVQLSGNKKAFWRYRIGDYRVICRFEDNEMIIVAVKIGHRRDIYH
jgi:mRNA interferase RelE/StbE